MSYVATFTYIDDTSEHQRAFDSVDDARDFYQENCDAIEYFVLEDEEGEELTC